MRGTGSHRQPRGCAGKRGGTGKWGGRKDERVWIRSWLPPKDLDPVDITTPSCFKADSASCAESESGQSRAKTRTLAGRPLRRDDGGAACGHPGAGARCRRLEESLPPEKATRVSIGRTAYNQRPPRGSQSQCRYKIQASP